MTISWTHITIGVSEFRRSIRFYENYCDLKIVRDRRDPKGEGTVWLGTETDSPDNPNFVLVLMKTENFPLVDHMGFQCDSRETVEKIAERAETEGILEYPPTDSGGAVGFWTIIRDPDGHSVEFTYGQPIAGLR